MKLNDLKIEESFFSANTENYDKKNKLNRSKKILSKNVVDTIEQGITIEDIDDLSKNVPIFKYKTQITIHGQFPVLENNYVFGYKNVFQNKNKSIGIRYSCIDESKRQYLKKRLAMIGLKYHRNSSKHSFYIFKSITKENFDSVKKELFGFKQKIKSELFFGDYRAYFGSYFGMKFGVFEIEINAIYEKNLIPFCQSLGVDEEKYLAYQKEIDDKNEKERAERDKRWAKERAEEQKNKSIAESQIKNSGHYVYIEKTNDCGVYVKPGTDWSGNIQFSVRHIFKTSPTNKRRYFTITKLNSIDDVLNFVPEIPKRGKKVFDYHIKSVWRLK